MNCSHLSKSLNKSVIIGVLVLGLAPIQVLAKVDLTPPNQPETFDCNPTLSIQTMPPGILIYQLGETITLSADLGAGDLDENDFMRLSTFGIGRDCAIGNSFVNCASQGNDVEFLNVMSTDCEDVSDSTVTFSAATRAANNVYTDFTSSSPIIFGTGETCNVKFNLRVNQLDGPTEQIFQRIGFPIPGSNAVCGEGGEDVNTGEASASIFFNIEEDPLAVFIVSKNFTDDNPMPVEVQITCNTGLPIKASHLIKDGERNNVSFVVEKFKPGDLNCDVVEVVPEGYSELYAASTVDGVSGPVTDDDLGCHFTQVERGIFRCDVTNSPDPVEIIVHKKWIEFNPDLPRSKTVRVTLHCDDPILHEEGGMGMSFIHQAGSNASAEVTKGNKGRTSSSADIAPGDPGIWVVIPPYDGSYCWVTENPPSSDVEADVSDCDDLFVEPGKGDECTVVNTRFFEGIPTLDHYGMILLALLILGMGAISTRRFA